MNQLIAGYGQIGHAVYQTIFSGTMARFDNIYIKDSKNPKETIPVLTIDVLHVCFPYSENFVDLVKDYIKRFKVQHVIIWSTVPIGTTKKINGAVHSPVEGVHPMLDASIKSMVRWIGANHQGEGEFFVNYFKDKYIKARLVDSSDYTEALKLLSTTEYGVNIEFARYKKQVADDLGMDFTLTKEWNRDYNKLYHNLDIPWAKKYVLDAPVGKIGGHCIVPNAKLLHKQYPDDLVERVVGL